MCNILYFVVVISFLTFSDQSWSQSVHSDSESTLQDTIVYRPGFFTWDENTVIKTANGQPLPILRYQQILDHTNTDFSDSPESVIILTIDPAGNGSQDPNSYTIEISEDSLQILARSESDMERALSQVKRMKMDADKNSPDYGLIYLRCGLYREENF